MKKDYIPKSDLIAHEKKDKPKLSQKDLPTDSSGKKDNQPSLSSSHIALILGSSIAIATLGYLLYQEKKKRNAAA